MTADVAVIVPTLRRPDSLERALRSLFAQERVADRVCEIVIADNDPEAPPATASRPCAATAPGRWSMSMCPRPAWPRRATRPSAPPTPP
ncbi:glycosyltransferase family 2 protein [Brevundimonas abyssalis]|uniref:glycosyltransferase family 2 protein n=1 Tax=Brevundimonas abyssalis TaxID=1125965 RepID=UPI001F586613|nr:glycosyltransferase [Brevundimonas abyssalis]